MGRSLVVLGRSFQIYKLMALTMQIQVKNRIETNFGLDITSSNFPKNKLRTSNMTWVITGQFGTARSTDSVFYVRLGDFYHEE